jgi:hypothetical protein
MQLGNKLIAALCAVDSKKTATQPKLPIGVNFIDVGFNVPPDPKAIMEPTGENLQWALYFLKLADAPCSC